MPAILRASGDTSDTGALATADAPPPPDFSVSPARLALLFAPQCSPSVGELFSGCASASVVGCINPHFVAIRHCHLIPRLGNAHPRFVTVHPALSPFTPLHRHSPHFVTVHPASSPFTPTSSPPHPTIASHHYRSRHRNHHYHRHRHCATNTKATQRWTQPPMRYYDLPAQIPVLSPLLKPHGLVIMTHKPYTAHTLALAPPLRTTCGPRNSQVLPSLQWHSLVITMHNQYTARMHGTGAIVGDHMWASELASAAQLSSGTALSPQHASSSPHAHMASVPLSGTTSGPQNLPALPGSGVEKVMVRCSRVRMEMVVTAG